jgi:hypothetical protein
MLAKQGWRLIDNQDSLCASILKAKYFPEGDVLNASPCRNMSYTWRSILKGIEILKEGIVWRIGGGNKVDIWNDPWLPRETTRRPVTPRGHTIISKVAELINPITSSWDEKLVRQLFVPQDVDLILATSVHPELGDMVAWHYDKRGIFSVSIAYKVHRSQIQISSERSGASSKDGGALKKAQWKEFKMPGKGETVPLAIFS